MMIRVLRHTEIGGQRMMMGDQLVLSVFDKILEDGRLVYHIDHGQRYVIVQPEYFKVVYSSHDEMQSFMDAPKYAKSVRQELERLTEEEKRLTALEQSLSRKLAFVISCARSGEEFTDEMLEKVGKGR